MVGMTGVILKMQVSDTVQEKVQLISFCQGVEFLLSKQGDKLKANDSASLFKDAYIYIHTHYSQMEKMEKSREKSEKKK